MSFPGGGGEITRRVRGYYTDYIGAKVIEQADRALF